MRASLANVGAVLMVLAVSGASMGQTAPRAEDAQRVERLVATLTQEAATLCPLSDPGDQHALDRCRVALFKDSYFKRSLARIVLWGRPSPVAGARLKDTNLTQFGAEVLSGLYLPMFMFNGRYQVTYDTTEARYRARLEGVFRNNLIPGQYPYPFWHDAKKWSDDKREPQPKPALFVGLFRADNPYLDQLQTTYKDLALAMRNGTCNTCHVPDNPDKMKRLVLLQTPAHAAAEISRVMAAVGSNRMPRDELGLEKELDAATKAVLLK